MKSVLFSLGKIRVKPATVLIETVISGDSLYHARKRTFGRDFLLMHQCVMHQGVEVVYERFEGVETLTKWLNCTTVHIII